eukprot:6456090-Amphidinium_carterae.1
MPARPTPGSQGRPLSIPHLASRGVNPWYAPSLVWHRLWVVSLPQLLVAVAIWRPGAPAPHCHKLLIPVLCVGQCLLATQ